MTPERMEEIDRNCAKNIRQHPERLQHWIEADPIELRELIAEHKAMADRLIETEEIFRTDDGSLRWVGSGEPIAE